LGESTYSMSATVRSSNYYQKVFLLGWPPAGDTR
jgi:hypothetical protein